jgi:capsular polysaccharide biosynthesis protein
MELREYWQIVWRRRQIIVPLVLVTFIASAIANLILPPTYKTETTVHVQAVIPPPTQNPYFSEEYYRTVQSEYMTDDLGVIIKTRTFAERVRAQIEQRYGQDVDVRDVMDAIATTKKLHRTLKVTVATGNYALTKRIGESVDDVLSRDGDKLVTKDDYNLIAVNVIDPPRDPTSPSILRRLLDVLLHSSVALVVGAGLAFLMHAMDDRVQNEQDAAQTMGWPILGTIPNDGTLTVNGGASTFGWIDGLTRRLRRGRQNGSAGLPRPARALRNQPARRPAAAARAAGRPRRLP